MLLPAVLDVYIEWLVANKRETGLTIIGIWGFVFSANITKSIIDLSSNVQDNKSTHRNLCVAEENDWSLSM